MHGLARGINQINMLCNRIQNNTKNHQCKYGWGGLKAVKKINPVKKIQAAYCVMFRDLGKASGNDIGAVI